MANHADERQNIIGDLQAWIRQNRAQGAEWYLDEGSRPEVIPVTAEPEVAEAAALAPAPTEPAKPAKSTKSEPPAKPAPPAPANDKEAAFRARCDQFVGETMALIKCQAEADPTAPVTEPLLTAHADDAAAAMAALEAEVRPCTACDLSGTRQTTVFGTGNPGADVVFIGEAPGQEEDQQGEPFVGASGQLLTKILGALGYSRDDVYICNILKCRPPNNRDPQPHEVQHCEPHLKRQLAILQPRVICCLGRVAAQTLLKTDLSLGKLRNSVHFYAGVPVMATFHPAALLRNPSWKRDTWDDVRKLQALSEALQVEEG
ncbi:MAG: uracil-DNA glycosylase [Candidatus Krumholzibacteria bacterium]|nr:uracil-DNA glycosylase [Candidatus Krumholzibacteria bacterium]